MCIWECTIDPEDLMPVEVPPTKRNKKTDSDEEDDVNIEETVEKTDKQIKAYEDSLLKSRNLPLNNKLIIFLPLNKLIILSQILRY